MRVQGSVLVRESGLGIAYVTVSLEDTEGFVSAEPGQVLASSVTEDGGVFDLTVETTAAPSRAAAGEGQGQLTLSVYAPAEPTSDDDPCVAPREARLLFCAPVWYGSDEAFVIRLPVRRLVEFGLAAPDAVAAQEHSTTDAAAVVGRRLREHRDKQSQRRAAAVARAARFTPGVAGLEGGGLVAASPEEALDRQHEALRVPFQRLAAADAARRPQIRLRLSHDAIDALGVPAEDEAVSVPLSEVLQLLGTKGIAFDRPLEVAHSAGSPVFDEVMDRMPRYPSEELPSAESPEASEEEERDA